MRQVPAELTWQRTLCFGTSYGRSTRYQIPKLWVDQVIETVLAFYRIYFDVVGSADEGRVLEFVKLK